MIKFSPSPAISHFTYTRKTLQRDGIKMDYNNKNYDTGQNTYTHKNIQIEHFAGHDFCAFNVCSVICFQFF